MLRTAPCTPISSKSSYVKLTGNAQTGQVESRPKPLLRLADYTLMWIAGPWGVTSTDLAELLQTDFRPLSFGILCQQRCIQLVLAKHSKKFSLVGSSALRLRTRYLTVLCTKRELAKERCV